MEMEFTVSRGDVFTVEWREVDEEDDDGKPSRQLMIKWECKVLSPVTSPSLKILKCEVGSALSVNEDGPGLQTLHPEGTARRGVHCRR